MLTLHQGAGSGTEVRWVDVDPDTGMKNTSFFVCNNQFHTVELLHTGDKVLLRFNGVDGEAPVPGGFYLKGDMYVGGVPGQFACLCVTLFGCPDRADQVLRKYKNIGMQVFKEFIYLLLRACCCSVGVCGAWVQVHLHMQNLGTFDKDGKGA